MIYLDGVTCLRQIGKNCVVVLDQVSAELPTNRRFVILGLPGAGKTTLLQLISGELAPNAGEIRRSARVSFPVGFQGGFDQKLTVAQNIEYVCNLYEVDVGEVSDFVGKVLELDGGLKRPLRGLTRQQRAKFGFALSYGMPFDTYLIDGQIGSGDQAFRERCLQMLTVRAERSGLIIATSVPTMARRLGDCGAILFNGKLYVYADLASALAEFEALSAHVRPEQSMSEAQGEGEI